MDISIIIATNSKKHQFIHPIVDSILKSPHKTEVLVVSQYKIDLPNVKWIPEPNPTGSCAAFNLGATYATGDYIGILPDDWSLNYNWWHVINFMKVLKTSIAAFHSGHMAGIPVAYCPFVTRELYEGHLMKKHIFNPAYRHLYIDNDLSIRLYRHGVITAGFPAVSVFHEEWDYLEGGTYIDPEKWASKHKWYRVDGMIFNKIWGHRVPGLSELCPLYHESPETDDVNEKDSDERVANDIYKDVY